MPIISQKLSLAQSSSISMIKTSNEWFEYAIPSAYTYLSDSYIEERESNSQPTTES